MAKKKTTKGAKKHLGLNMSDGMREKCARLISDALDSMEDAKWQKPWICPHSAWPQNIYYDNPYKGINLFMLTMLMEYRGWELPYFVTRKAMMSDDKKYKYKGLVANASLKTDESGCAIIDDKGMPVMDVEKRFPVIVYKPIRRDAEGHEVKDEDYEDMTEDERKEVHTYWLQKAYLVYNLEQTNFKELYPDEYKKMTEIPEHDYKQGTRDEVLERMIFGGEWRCPIRFGGVRSCYHVGDDFISLPRREAFMGDAVFYATAIHEMAHSTAPELKRDVANVFGSADYATEELIAEITSAIICSMLGIGKLLDPQHIAYVKSWRQALRDNLDFMPVVMDHAHRAVNYFLNKYNEVAQQAEVAVAA